MRRWFCVFLLTLFILLKLWIPSNAQLQRQILSFLGLERETVQAFGHSLRETEP